MGIPIIVLCVVIAVIITVILKSRKPPQKENVRNTLVIVETRSPVWGQQNPIHDPTFTSIRV